MTNTKVFVSFALTLFVLVLVSGAVSAETLGEWSLTASGSATSSHSDVSASAFSGGSGISAITYGGNGAYAGQWSLGAFDSDDYFQITLAPNAGYDLAITNLNFFVRRSGTGPASYDVMWSKSASFSSPTALVSGATLADDLSHDGSTSASISVEDGETVYIRWFGYDATDPSGTLRIDADTLNVQGTATVATTNPSLDLTVVSEMTQSSDGSIKVENDGDVTLTGIDLSSTGDFEVTFSNDNFALAPGASETITVSAVDLGEIDFGGKTIAINATADDDTTDGVSMTVEGSFCDAGEAGGSLKIKDIEIDNNGDGDDDEWMLLDEVEIEVEIENTGNDDVDDVIVVLGFYNDNGNDETSDLEFENDDEEEIDLGDLDEDDEETVTFKFKVPADFEDGDYKLVIKAYSDDLEEENECVDTANDHTDGNDKYTKIDVQREDDEGKFIAFEDIEFTPAEATCGETVTMTLDVYNVGDEDLEDQIKIELRNTALGISEFVEIRTDLDQGDNEQISFDFVIPQGAEDKFHTLKLSAEYDYKRGSYRESSDDDEDVQFRVIGCGPAPGGSDDKIAIISASMDSDEAVAGETVVVRASVTNLKSQRAGLIVDAVGYQSWGSLDDVSPRVVDLAPGESADVLLTFTLDDDADGEESFDIQVKDGSSNIETREIALNIEGTSSASGGIGLPSLGDNAFLWVIGIINVVLVVLIIIVAVRVARR